MPIVCINLIKDLKMESYFKFRLEEERLSGTEARAALRNLVLMISSLCACGFSELRPTRANTELFQLQGFVLPQPSTPGQAVRNVQAFQVSLNCIYVNMNNIKITRLKSLFL